MPPVASSLNTSWPSTAIRPYPHDGFPHLSRAGMMAVHPVPDVADVGFNDKGAS